MADPQREWLPHQSAFILDKSPDPLLMDGGFGAAKTDALCCAAYLDAELYPGNLILVGRHQYTDLADSTIKSFFALPYVQKNASTWNEGRATYKHPNGSEILFRHLDEDAGLKNLNLGGVYIDQAEEILPNRFDLLLGRLRRPNSARKMRLTANPNGHDWLWQWFYGPGSVAWRSPHVEEFYTASPDYRDGYKVIRCSTKDNPHLPPDYVARLLKDYPPEFIEQYVNGSREVMLGYRFFDPIAMRQQVVSEPITVLAKPGIGYFVDGLPKPEWRPQEGGPVRLYELRDERDLYCIGADIATGEGSSRCAGVALNCRMNRTAAVIDADLRPDEHALQLWFMSRYYGGAVVAPERNGIGFACVTALSQLTANLYRDGAHIGWLTDDRSRSELFAQLQREIAAPNATQLKDNELIEQCKAITMRKHGKTGRPMASEGFRDDLVIARGIAGMVRKLRAGLQAQASPPSYQQAQPNTIKPEGFVENAAAYGSGRGRVKVAGR